MYAAVDCTGHGVPGAFMSLVGANGLNSAVHQHKLDTPSEILNALNTYVSDSLNKGDQDSKIRDGMDMTLCAVDYDTLTLEYAGANNPLYIIRDGEFVITKADKFAIASFLPNENGLSKTIAFNCRKVMQYMYSLMDMQINLVEIEEKNSCIKISETYYLKFIKNQLKNNKKY